MGLSIYFVTKKFINITKHLAFNLNTWVAAQPPIDGKQLAADPMPTKLNKPPILCT